MNILLVFFVVLFVAVSQAVAGNLCDVVPIEQWAGAPSGLVQELSKPVEMVVVTHTVTPECFTDQACERVARNIRNSHMQQGFSDIRLSFLVGGNGKIYEGAGWKVGRHSTGYNEKSISISFMGDYSRMLPTEAALTAAERFLGCFLNTRYLDCEYRLVGHRQLINTVSPGDALQNHIQTWPHWTRNPQY